jgi:hypothetical protein
VHPAVLHINGENPRLWVHEFNPGRQVNNITVAIAVIHAKVRVRHKEALQASLLNPRRLITAAVVRR